jgi:GTP cyclohydrolase I
MHNFGDEPYCVNLKGKVAQLICERIFLPVVEKVHISYLELREEIWGLDPLESIVANLPGRKFLQWGENCQRSDVDCTLIALESPF